MVLLLLLILTRMAWPIAAEALAEGGAAEGAAGAGEGMGGMGGMMKDFNDNPAMKIGGQLFGKLVTAAKGSIGTHGGDQEKANIGPVGEIT